MFQVAAVVMVSSLLIFSLISRPFQKPASDRYRMCLSGEREDPGRSVEGELSDMEGLYGRQGNDPARESAIYVLSLDHRFAGLSFMSSAIRIRRSGMAKTRVEGWSSSTISPRLCEGNVDVVDEPLTRHPRQAPAWNAHEIDDVLAFLKTLTDADAKGPALQGSN